MKSDQSTLEDQISRLPDRERARLALRLLESLEPGSDENVDELWLDEAERRLGDYDKGWAWGWLCFRRYVARESVSPSGRGHHASSVVIFGSEAFSDSPIGFIIESAPTRLSS